MAPGGEQEVPQAAVPVPPRVNDDERNADWLDNIYFYARLIILFSIVYFYSSPARFMVVTFLALIMYM